MKEESTLFYISENRVKNKLLYLLEYKVWKDSGNNEEKKLDAIWQCLTRNYLSV